jgi:hypothetical protein
VEEKSGSEFDPDVARPFVQMMRGLEGKVVRPAGLDEASLKVVDREQLAED